MLSNSIRIAIKYFLLLILLFFGFLYLYNNINMVQALKSVPPKYLIIMISSTYFIFLANGLNFRYLVSVFGIHLSYKEYFGLTVSNTMFNYYIPAKGGNITRAYYLKQKQSFQYKNYLSLLGGDYILNIFVSAFVSLVLIGLVYITKKIFYYKIFFVCGIVLLICFLIYALAVKYLLHFSFKSKNNIISYLVQIINGLSEFNKNPQIIFKVLITNICLMIFLGIRLYFAFLSIGIDSDFFSILIIQSLVSISMIVSITPGNLGVKEGLIGAFSSSLGVSMPDAIFAASLDRIIAIICTFVLGFYYSRGLYSELK